LPDLHTSSEHVRAKRPHPYSGGLFLQSEKVRILIFDGVAPRKYLTFFTNFAERKRDGKTLSLDYETIKPKISKSLQALPTLEQQAIHSLRECGLIND
jgi:hypothetical protein